MLSLTDGQGVDRIVEVDISANAPTYDRILAPRGVSVIYGTGGPIAEVPAGAFIPRGAELKWFIVYEMTEAEVTEGVEYLNRMLAEDSHQTTIAARFALENIVAAHELVESAKYVGNVVLDIVGD